MLIPTAQIKAQVKSRSKEELEAEKKNKEDFFDAQNKE